jgi:class 3 adenylate cyclase
MENIRIAMNRGAFDFITKPVDFKDLELTMEKTILHVLEMRKTMRAIKENNILKMYVDETVLNFIDTLEFEETMMLNETVEASVVFIDICGFTAFAEQQEPDAVVNLLNRYFDIMVEEVIGQNGYVDKFIGDALMAVFREDYHLDRAIDAALAIRNKIQNLPEEDFGFRPEVSIGINCGEMVYGNIGSAALRRLDYTVIGDTVNTAQRLEVAAQDGQILISRASYDIVKESFKCRRVGEILLKNKPKPVEVYEVLE